MILGIHLFANPVADSSSKWYRELTRLSVSQAQFSTLALGGFGDGNCTIDNPPQSMIDEALESWLTKRVTFIDGAGNTAYEGFVAEIQIQNGYHTFTRSIDPFFNRAFIEYNYSGGNCPAGGQCYGRIQRNETDVLSTSSTQTSIGIKEEWLDYTGSGVLTSTLATYTADNELRQRLYNFQGSFSFGGGATPNPPQIQLTFWGYWTTLQWRKQTLAYPGPSGITEISAIIKNLLTVGSKAQFLSTDLTQITGTGRNTQYNTGFSPVDMQRYITDLIDGGDSTGKTLFFQVKEGRVPTLFSRSSSPKYFAQSNDPRLFDLNRMPIAPYLVRAGGYILTDDLRAPLDEASDVIYRARASLITETTYDAVNDTLTFAPPTSLISQAQLLTRARRQARPKLH